MGVFSDLYERLLRRFQRHKPGSRQTSLKRTHSLPRDAHKDRATIVVRPRSNTTEVTIERRRVSSRADWINRSVEKQSDNNNVQTELDKKREKMMTRTDSETERHRTQTTSIVIMRGGEGKKPTSNGSILAPTYHRTRAASIKQQHSVITISI